MTPSADRREREKHEMRERILDAAITLFATESFERTTMRRLADAIDYTPGALYSYFKDKDQILFALHQRGFEKLNEYTAPARALVDPIERLTRIGELYVKFAVENGAYYDLMFIESKTGEQIAEKQDWPQGQRAYDLLRETVTEAIAQRRLHTTDVEAAAFAYWSFVHGMVSLSIRQRCAMIPSEDLPQVMKHALEFLMRSTTRSK